MLSKPCTLIEVGRFIVDIFLNPFYFVTFCLITDKQYKNSIPLRVPLTKQMLKTFSPLLFTAI